jgi:hypothetical protein
MVMGLRYGGLTPEDSVAKEKTYTMVGELVTKFKALHSPVACTDLLGYNLSDPQQYADAKAHKVAKEKCAAFIRDAVELVKTSSLGFKTVSLLARLFCNNDERISFVRHFVS